MTYDGQSIDVTFHASDGFYDTPKTISITVTANQPPVIDVQPAAAPLVTVGGTVSLTVSAYDPEDGTLPVSIESLPAGASFDGTAFTWSPPASAGPYTDIVFVADDGGPGGQVNRLVRITVNRNPVIAPLADAAVYTGQPVEFQVSASDADNDPVAIAVDPVTQPDGASFDGTTFSWTPLASQVGAHAITFTADDGRGGTHSVTATVTVVAPPADSGGGGGGGCFLTILGGG